MKIWVEQRDPHDNPQPEKQGSYVGGGGEAGLSPEVEKRRTSDALLGRPDRPDREPPSERRDSTASVVGVLQESLLFECLLGKMMSSCLWSFAE